MDQLGQALSVLCLTAQSLTSKCLREVEDSRAQQVSHAHTKFGVKRKTHSLLPF
nr:MAG TPA: hypothetical protein [Caudoviricetes sp.]